MTKVATGGGGGGGGKELKTNIQIFNSVSCHILCSQPILRSNGAFI